MAEREEQHPEEFPDIGQKLAAPKKISQFERDRQAAEEKRKRAEAENAAALKEFQDSFADNNDDDDPLSHLSGRRGPPSGPRGVGFGGRGGRHGMPPPGPRSGPGGLPGAPPSLKRKRALDELREAEDARREQGVLAFSDSREDTSRRDSETHDEDREDDAPRPNLLLSNLPPTTTTDDVKALLAPHVKVYSVRFLPPVGPGQPSGKRTASAVASLSSDITTGQMESTVGALKDKYLGWGFYLSISRHLSSVAINPSLSRPHTTVSNEPFGAQTNRSEHGRMSLRNAPPPPEHRQGMFAPPSQYSSRISGPRSELFLDVQPPPNLATIRVVHTVAEQLLMEPNPERALEKEAMLMSIPEVQRDERFAFLFDSKSIAGSYYRYILWAPDPVDERADDQRRRAKNPDRVFADFNMEWQPPFANVPFPDLSGLAQAITDIDYVSSDDDSDDEDAGNKGREGDGSAPFETVEHLAPLQKARLVYLLSRLPTTNTRLRQGDVARVTNFAIHHAATGAEEIVDTLLLNIDKPLCNSLAAKFEDSDVDDGQDEDEYEPEETLPTIEDHNDASLANPEDVSIEKTRSNDPSNAKLIALYLISDLLSASATAGARNAWKYRQLFEGGFKALGTFQRLGRLEKDLNWGRMKAEQWKRRVGVLFGIWEGWSVFAGDVLEELKKDFFEPPLTEEEKAAAEAEERREKAEKWKSKFKKVELGSVSASPAPVPHHSTAVEDVENGDVDTSVLEDVDGQPMDEEDIEGKPMENEDLDGKPMEEDDIDGQPMGDDIEDRPTQYGDVDGTSMVNDNTINGPGKEPSASNAVDESVAQEAKRDSSMGFAIKGAASSTAGRSSSPQQPTSRPRRRLRAEDMFADSDEE
ncbi:hypothetical protein K431DRAFT_287877 [Polychaeton citri CBS 116435]|uniref:CID domain-containing protein n=1 Tax=Polychaeton citri CBS 116435 TaxID=1314669 RepID=A0A9P4ULS7_9PEZI|nr:hypothetical protein K431DRAFT_287877 [Polychaeton citri CBS 116435]